MGSKIDLECVECGFRMFENQANGLTCSNKKCGIVLFSCSAIEHLRLLTWWKTCKDLIEASQKVQAIQEELIENQKKLIELKTK